MEWGAGGITVMKRVQEALRQVGREAGKQEPKRM